MRIGNWLGGSVIMALAAIHEYGGNGTAPPSTSRLSRWEVPWTGSPAIVITASTFRRASAASSRSRRPTGQIVELKGPNGTPLVNGQDIGFDQQGWYTFKVEGAKKPYSVETTFVQVGAEHEEALELLLLADQGRLDSRALGWGQRPGRHDDRQRRRPVDRRAGRLHSARESTSSWPGPMACSKRCRQPATTRPGSPTSMTT